LLQFCNGPRLPGARNFVSRIKENELLLLKFVCVFAIRWTGTNGTGWKYVQSNYEEYVSDDEIYKLIQGLDNVNADAFSDLEKVKLASFVLNYGKDEFYEVNEQRAREYAERWGLVYGGV